MLNRQSIETQYRTGETIVFNNVQVTIVGNLGDDPESRHTPTGAAVTTFNVAVPNRKYDRDSGKWSDAGTTWYRVNAWRDLAEHCAESLTRGSRVIVVGNLAARPWEDRDGNKRESWEITADAVGPDLSFATAQVKRSRRESAPEPDDPWSGDGGSQERSRPRQEASEPGQAPAESESEPVESAGQGRKRQARRTA
jgi:single-strand DNA-binding protein